MDSRLIDIVKLRKEMRAQDERKHRDPDHDKTLPTIWVAYCWDESNATWLLAGFTRMKTLTLDSIAALRLYLSVPEESLIQLVEIQHARRHGPPCEPPTQYNPMVERAWLAPSLRTTLV